MVFGSMFRIVVFVSSISFFNVLLAQDIPLEFLTSKSPKIVSNFQKGILTSPEYGHQILSGKHPMFFLNFFNVGMPYDFVFGVTKNKRINMIELIALTEESGELIWFVLESFVNGDQFVILPSSEEDKHIVQDFCNKLSIDAYPGALEVHHKKSEGKDFFKVRYDRKEILKDRQLSGLKSEVDLTFYLKKGASLDNFEKREKFKVKNSRKKNRRNSHTMNHSENSIFSLLDIHSRVRDVFAIKYSEKSNQKIQRIFGFIPVKALISQYLVGFSSTPAEKEEFKCILNSPSEVVYEREFLNNRAINSVQRYYFKKDNQRLNLKKIEGLSNEEIKAVVVFSPSLPDLRFEILEKAKSMIEIFVNGRENLEGGSLTSENLFYVGAVDVLKTLNNENRLKISFDQSLQKSKPAKWLKRKTLEFSVNFKSGVRRTRTYNVLN